MAIQSDQDEKPSTAEPGAEESMSSEAIAPTDATETAAPTGQLGSQRYVHAAFFVAGILIAYVASKILGAAWSELADWTPAARAVPQLVSIPEDEREQFTMAAGAVLGIASVVQVYRKEAIRHWADDVASELSKVTWPNRETVVNGTLVVVIASAIATVYVAILDRFWSFLTQLVYGT
ncbi:MAG: preprotein translocase subunit SecE [Myxococcota bacterium]